MEVSADLDISLLWEIARYLKVYLLHKVTLLQAVY